MRKYLYSFRLELVWILLICIYTLKVHADDPIAMITDISGDVIIITNNEDRSCELLDSIHVMDKIQLNDNSNLTLVYFNNSKEYKISGKNSVIIETNGPSIKSGYPLDGKELNILKNSKLSTPKTKYKQAALVFRGTVSQKKIQIIRPIESKMLSKPIFEWKPVKGIQDYSFTLNGDSGNNIYKINTSNNKVVLPESINLNKGATYYWTVEINRSGSIYKISSKFSMLSQNEIDKIKNMIPDENATFSERVIIATYLEQNGILDEAKKQWKILSDERPDIISLKEKIIW